MQCRVRSQALAVEGVARGEAVSGFGRLPEGADNCRAPPKGSSGQYTKKKGMLVATKRKEDASAVLVCQVYCVKVRSSTSVNQILIVDYTYTVLQSL